jgi:hypothetical protein
MKTINSLFRMKIGAGDTDAFLMRLAQMICFITGGSVFVFGLLKVCREDLTGAQLFSAVQQVIQTVLLFWIVGLLMRPKSKAA